MLSICRRNTIPTGYSCEASNYQHKVKLYLWSHERLTRNQPESAKTQERSWAPQIELIVAFGIQPLDLPRHPRGTSCPIQVPPPIFPTEHQTKIAIFLIPSINKDFINHQVIYLINIYTVWKAYELNILLKFKYWSVIPPMTVFGHNFYKDVNCGGKVGI